MKQMNEVGDNEDMHKYKFMFVDAMAESIEFGELIAGCEDDAFDLAHEHARVNRELPILLTEKMIKSLKKEVKDLK
jgi:predicted transcriptional regulator|tara:strand:+ start:664 stop:891 length:228 start_codon:yes stop_codon:yes gene_type:complete